MNELDPRIGMSTNHPIEDFVVGIAATERSEVAPRSSNEVVLKRKRRRFSAKEKIRILDLIDKCTDPGEMGMILRKEGIFSSYVANWREQRRLGELSGLSEKKRGRRPLSANPLTAKLAAAERENVKLKKRLEKAELIIGFQKKFLETFGEIPNSLADERKS